MFEILAPQLHHAFMDMSRSGLKFAIIQTVAGECKCYKIEESRQDFFVAVAGPWKFISQNMKKRSPNTDWVAQDPQNRFLTWVTEAGRYVGKISTYINDRGNLCTDLEVFSQ